VDHWASNQQSRLETARMPWHDVHMTLVGPVVLDIAQHFVERWNYIRDKKYKHDDRYPILRFPHDVTKTLLLLLLMLALIFIEKTGFRRRPYRSASPFAQVQRSGPCF
jgi:phosphatidylserine/phosphatidylglycerophosphate/cardiolipin synthase-like enzyme